MSDAVHSSQDEDSESSCLEKEKLGCEFPFQPSISFQPFTFELFYEKGLNCGAVSNCLGMDDVIKKMQVSANCIII